MLGKSLGNRGKTKGNRGETLGEISGTTEEIWGNSWENLGETFIKSFIFPGILVRNQGVCAEYETIRGAEGATGEIWFSTHPIPGKSILRSGDEIRPLKIFYFL